MASSAGEDKSRVFTVVDLAAIKQRDQKEHEKRLKVIEVKSRKRLKVIIKVKVKKHMKVIDVRIRKHLRVIKVKIRKRLRVIDVKQDKRNRIISCFKLIALLCLKYAVKTCTMDEITIEI